MWVSRSTWDKPHKVSFTRKVHSALVRSVRGCNIWSCMGTSGICPLGTSWLWQQHMTGAHKNPEQHHTHEEPSPCKQTVFTSPPHRYLTHAKKAGIEPFQGWCSQDLISSLWAPVPKGIPLGPKLPSHKLWGTVTMSSLISKLSITLL